MPATTGILLAVYLAVVAAIGWLSGAAARPGRGLVLRRATDRFSPVWGFLGLASLTTGGSTTVALAASSHARSRRHLARPRGRDRPAAPRVAARRARPPRGRRHAARDHRALLRRRRRAAWPESSSSCPRSSGSPCSSRRRRSSFRPRPACDPIVAIVGSTAVFVLYTALGGQFAVVRTDGLQYGLMVLAIPGLALGFTLARGARSPAPAAGGSTSRRPPRFGDATSSALLVLIGLPHLVGSDVYAKLLSCRDEQAARRAALAAALSKVALRGAVAAIALAARAALPAGPAITTLPARRPRVRAGAPRVARARGPRRDDALLGRRRAPLRGRRHGARRARVPPGGARGGRRRRRPGAHAPLRRARARSSPWRSTATCSRR